MLGLQLLLAILTAGDAISSDHRGWFSTCGIKSDSTVACWGSNSHGQSSAPVGLFTQLASGASHVCGIRNNSTAACWGHNLYGQSSPPAGSLLQIAAGTWHS